MSKLYLQNVVMTFVLLGWAVLPLSATIIDGTVTGGSALDGGGTFIKLGVPIDNPFGPANSVGRNTFNTLNLYGFDEDQNILLTAPLETSVGLELIPAGTFVASHYVFFDPGPNRTILGTVDFDSDVLAIITGRNLLAASDFLANTGVNYLNPGARGLERGDSVTISGARQILFDTRAISPGDYVRVLTSFSPGAEIPEPGSIALLTGGLAFLALRVRGRGRSNGTR